MTISGREDWEIIPHRWTKEELDYLVLNYGTSSIVQIARTLHRTIRSVTFQLGAIRRSGSMEAMRCCATEPPHSSCRNWKKEELQLLGQMIEEGKTVPEISVEIGRTWASVTQAWSRYHHDVPVRCGHSYRLTEARKERVRELILGGKNDYEISLVTGHVPDTIYRIREEMKKE